MRVNGRLRGNSTRILEVRVARVGLGLPLDFLHLYIFMLNKSVIFIRYITHRSILCSGIAGMGSRVPRSELRDRHVRMVCVVPLQVYVDVGSRS